MFAFMEKVEKPPLGSQKSYMPITEARLIDEVETGFELDEDYDNI